LSQKPNKRKQKQTMPLRPNVGVCVLITKDDKILLMKHKNSLGVETWYAPGGHLEYGEFPEEYVIREMLEEMGLIITDVAFLAITNDVFESRKKHYVTIWLAARYASGELSMNTAYEISAVDWFSWDALPEPLFLPLEHLLTGQCYPALWDFSDRHG
jgi:8-oxo-dGTP diphosphatase